MKNPLSVDRDQPELLLSEYEENERFQCERKILEIKYAVPERKDERLKRWIDAIDR
jgi:hypothetical protein